MGMDKKDISKLFTMFSTLDTHKNAMNIRGTGIGLTISKKLTEMLGGKIEVKSEINVGTTFIFEIKESHYDHSVDSEHQINCEHHNAFFNHDEISKAREYNTTRAHKLKTMHCHHSKMMRKL